MENKYSAIIEKLELTQIIYRKQQVLLFFLLFFYAVFAFAQQPRISADIDPDSIKIGEQINYRISVEADSASLVVFPEGDVFSPMEMVESFPPDTNRAENRIRLLKEYSLTQFDSGRYTIPQQKIIIAGQEYLTDSMQVEVWDVVVDTTKQQMYPIKPSVEIPDRFRIPSWVWWLLAVLVIAGIAFYFFRRKKKKEEGQKELPPYEQAMLELERLDNSPLLQQREVKEYYSQLTASVRKYLDRKVYDRALESTTSELIAYLELNRDSGQLRLNKKTIDNLKLILQRADLAKFANSRPDVITAKGDRSKVEHIINDVRTSVPEPSEEELMKDEVYRKAKLRKRRKRRIIIGTAAGVLVLLVAIAVLVNTRGMDYIKDTVWGHPTRELLEGDWIRSEYGDPPVVVTTPEVLKRGEIEMPDEAQRMLAGNETFIYGSPVSNFYTVVSTVKFQGQVDFDLETAVDGVYAYLEEHGARNIIMKEEEFTTLNGAEGVKVFGTLEIENPVTGRSVQNEYVILNFAEHGGFQQITVIYNESDEYAGEIAQRIMNSVELQNPES